MKSETPQRYHALDNLRAGMISVVMFGHALLPYVTVPRHFKDPQTNPAFDIVTVFLYAFAMPAFFVTAGFAAALLYRRRGARGVARNRFQTIFLPLLAAYILLSPLTRGAYLFATEVATAGSLKAGIDVLLLGHWMHWGKAYHLWFLVSLLLYTTLAICIRWGLLRIVGKHTAQIQRLARIYFASRWRSVFLALITACTLIPAYVFADGNSTAMAMQATGFAYFLFGWMLFLHRDLLPAFRYGAWRQIAIAIAILPLAAWSTRLRLFASHEPDLLVGIIAGVSNGIIATCMTIGLLGVFQGRFDRRPSAIGQYISHASYWIYLIHLPLLVFVAGALSATSLPAAAKYLTTVFVVVPIVFASYHFCVRATRLGGFLKGRKNDQAVEQTALP